MSKYKIIALIGESGSGKDTLLKRVLEECPNLHEIVSCTTRPPREGEINGKNYFFLTYNEFAEKVLNMEMLEACQFRDWFYGTCFDSLDSNLINIGIFNPSGIYALLEYSNIDLIVYYIKANDKERLMRQLNREENPDIEEIFRRYKTDKKDFKFLDFDYTLINNNNEEELLIAINKIKNNII